MKEIKIFINDFRVSLKTFFFRNLLVLQSITVKLMAHEFISTKIMGIGIIRELKLSKFESSDYVNLLIEIQLVLLIGC